MKFFKKLLIAILSVLMVSSLALAVGCNDEDGGSTPPTGYTVKFMVEGTQYGETLTVQRGRRITAPCLSCSCCFNIGIKGKQICLGRNLTNIIC